MLIIPLVTLLCCSLYPVAAIDAAAPYHVAVSSSPQSPVPFIVGSVKLNCSVTPLPPGPVTYSWTAVPNVLYTSNPSSSNSALPTATASISFRTARHPTYYCHVLSNGNKVATGKLTLTIQGFLQYVSPPVAMFSPGDNVTLQFNVSNYYYASSIKTTHWFYKGWCIDCYSYDHYILDLSNTRLTILNASESDVGQYEVRVTELTPYTSDPPKCNALTLDLLKHHAAYTPVVYYLTSEGTSYNNELLFSENITLSTMIMSLYGTFDQALTATEKYATVGSTYFLYSNGVQASYLDNSGQPFYGTNGSHLLVNIQHYNESWAGEYAVAHYTNCHNVLDTLLQNCNSYFYLCYEIRIRYVLELILVHITTLETPVVKIQADYAVVHRGGTVTLNCSAEGGNPMDYTVQWMKDGQQLASTTSVPAVLLYTSPYYQQQFGVFTCSAINQYFHINKTVFIQERDSFQGLWVFSKPTKVLLLNNISEMQNTLNNVVISAMNSISVSWTLVDDYFHNCSLHLTALGGLYYRCDLVYSDPSGVNTASTILTHTQEWLMENNITTTINGDKLELSKLCTLRLDDSSMDTCYRVIERLAETTCNRQPTPSFSPVTTPSCPELSETTGNSVGAITGGFIGGLLLGVLTCAAGIAVILFCRFLLTRKKSNTDGQDGIELNVNTAYDTVKYERPPFQQKPPEPDTSQNPYENWVMT